MQLPDLSGYSIDFTAQHALLISYGALGCVSVLLMLSAWKNWGYPLWGKYMDARKRERDLLVLMGEHQVGALEYMVTEKLVTPQEMWKLAPKYDNIPGMRDKLRNMLKKHLPQATEVPKQSKLSEALS